MKITPYRTEDKGNLTCLNQMKFAEFGKTDVQFFTEVLEYYRFKNDTAEGEQRTAQQGICQFVTQLLEQVESARELYDKVGTEPEPGSMEFG